MKALRIALPVALAAALVGDAHARIYPAWSVAGQHAVDVDPGFAEVAGTFDFPPGGTPSSLTLRYDPAPRLTGAGLAGGLTIFSLEGTALLDSASGEQVVTLRDSAKNPLFEFEGVVAADGSAIAGTFVRRAGYLDDPNPASGPLTLTRTGGAASTAFRLAFGARMDDRGRVKGSLGAEGETRATLTVYGGTVLEGGKVRGKVKTDAAGVTTGKLTITGRRWKAKLVGPIDAAGFHAACDVTGAGFSVRGADVLLPVVAGPTPPVEPVKPPKNLLANATATVVNGQVTITHTRVPSKFFGKPAGLTVQFPFADGLATVEADSTTASGASPRRFIVTIGSKTYGTAAAPPGEGVTLEIRRLSNVAGGVIEVLATGRVEPASGRGKNVDVLLNAVVQ